MHYLSNSSFENRKEKDCFSDVENFVTLLDFTSFFIDLKASAVQCGRAGWSTLTRLSWAAVSRDQNIRSAIYDLEHTNLTSDRKYTQSPIITNGPIRLGPEFWGKFKKRVLGRSNLRNASKNYSYYMLQSTLMLDVQNLLQM